MRRPQALDNTLRPLPTEPPITMDAKCKNAGWKVALAAHLKATADLSNGWLAQRPAMASAFDVNTRVGRPR